MEPHVHISPVHMIAFAAAIVAITGTIHLIAIANPDNRFSRAYMALGY